MEANHPEDDVEILQGLEMVSQKLDKVIEILERIAGEEKYRALAKAAKKLYALHTGDLEVGDLQKSQEHMDAEEALFAEVDALEEADQE